MTYGSESDCATHYTTAPHRFTVLGLPRWSPIQVLTEVDVA